MAQPHWGSHACQLRSPLQSGSCCKVKYWGGGMSHTEGPCACHVLSQRAQRKKKYWADLLDDCMCSWLMCMEDFGPLLPDPDEKLSVGWAWPSACEEDCLLGAAQLFLRDCALHTVSKGSCEHSAGFCFGFFSLCEALETSVPMLKCATSAVGCSCEGI